MNKISIPTVTAFEAIVWASQHFGSFSFHVQHAFPADRYDFTFDRTEHASLFALRWMQ